jgi:ribokinase
MLEVDLVVVGSLNMDLVMQCERLPAAGETLSGRGFVQVHGGKGANQAVAAARAGARVAMVGAVGQDAYGDSLLAALQADGIDTRYVQVLPRCSTGIASIWVSSTGENSILLHGGANMELTASYVQLALEQIKAKALAVQGEIPYAANEAALRYATAQGYVCCVNPAPFQFNSNTLLARANLIVVNETEAAQTLQQESAQVASQARQALQDLCQQFPLANVVLTLGAQGAWQGRGTHATHYPASAVKVVDTTAAGDTLTGALLAGLLRGEPISLALSDAIVAAGICVSQLGAQSSIPHRQPTIAAIR